jgi:hypothetical protein
MKRFTFEEIAETLSLDLARLKEWTADELVVPSREDHVEFFVEEDVERFRVISNLMDDLEVNQEGVEVILGMRDKMISMEKWVRKVFVLLDEHKLLNQELMEEFKKF